MHTVELVGAERVGPETAHLEPLEPLGEVRKAHPELACARFKTRDEISCWNVFILLIETSIDTTQ